MQAQRSNIQKGKFSNYGSSIFAKPTDNTRYFKEAKSKLPTMRGSFPRAVRYSLDDEGIRNARIDYNRGLELSKSAVRARQNSERNYQSSFEGNAARRLAPEPNIDLDSHSSMHAHAGHAEKSTLIHSSALSPMFLSLAKVAAVVVCVIAILAFVRVGITSATVSTGLASQNISNKIDAELVNKNALEVQDSALGNTAHIRQAAAEYSLVAPASVETIVLDQDILAYDENKNVSLVESLNRVAKKTE